MSSPDPPRTQAAPLLGSTGRARVITVQAIRRSVLSLRGCSDGSHPDQGPGDVERHRCPKCTDPACSPRQRVPARAQTGRTKAEKAAEKYHTTRFVLVSALREELEVVVPVYRHPGNAWTQGPCVDPAIQEDSVRPFRVGYARCSVATQGLASQVDALKHVERSQVLSERVSTRIKIHPELQDAIRLARGINGAAPDQRVILTIREMKRLARNAAEFMTGTRGTNRP